MDNIDLQDLLNKYRAGTCSAEELVLLENWYAQWKVEHQVFTDDELVSLKDEVWLAMADDVRPVKQIKLWPRIAAVAAAVALIVLGVYFFNAPSRHLDDRRDLLTSAKDIAPGKNGATITLANGKVIQLSDAKTGVVIGDDKLAYNDGSVVGSLSASGGEMPEGQRGGRAVAKTAKGQTYIFTLPDGTKVWLNAASSLTIPSDFSGTETRKVELTGEAYFEVAKNKKRPFIVKSNGQEVIVLGTHFNVNAYKDEGSVRTTLLEGSVRVASLSPPLAHSTTPASPPLLAKEGTTIVLKPGQQSVVSGSNRIAVNEVNTEQAVAWKNNEFMFEEQPIKEVMKMIERWYNVEIIYQGEAPRDKFSGVVSRFDHVSKVLSVLESTGRIHFKISERKIYVSK